MTLIDDDNPEELASQTLSNYPPVDQWEDWVEYDAKRWPEKVERHYSLVPTVCFNCEAACGLLAYVDKATGEIQKLEGNPLHPASRGRNCAKGPATINQVKDPERILYPLKRTGERGEGKWERTTWNEVLETLAQKIRTALKENRRTEVMYTWAAPGRTDTWIECFKPGGSTGIIRIRTFARHPRGSDTRSGKARTVLRRTTLMQSSCCF